MKKSLRVCEKSFIFRPRSFTRTLGMLGLCALWPSVSHAAPSPEVRQTLSNGVTLLTRSERMSPRVGISILIKFGAADETPATAGWRRLLTDAMLRATKRPSDLKLPPAPANAAPPAPADAAYLLPSQSQAVAEDAGGRVGAAVGDDVVEFWATGNSSQVTRLTQLLVALIREPRLSDQDIDNARKALLDRVDNEESDVAARATRELRNRLYKDARGELVAYGLSPIGTLTTLNALTNDRVRELHKMFLATSRWTVSVAGDVDSPSIKSALEAVPPTGGAEAAAPTPYFIMPDSSQPPLGLKQMNTPAAWIFIAHPLAGGEAAGASSSDWPALRVLSIVLGELPQSRLARRLLDGRRALGGASSPATAVATQFTPRLYRSELVTFAETDSQNIEGVKNSMLDEMRKLGETQVPAAELETAKNYARGTWAVDREGLHDRAYFTALAANLAPASQAATLTDVNWPDRVAKVTAADVQRVAQKYLKSYAVVLILPQQ